MSVWYQMGQSVRNLLISLTSTSKAILDTESNIQARTDDELGTIAFATDTNKLYVFTDSGWQYAQ
jgi:hypothetical protein|tara:strand:+ start:1336 stop:1530 length:195 start_codon:yes stop_codon:yes gene_type:complete